MVTLVSTRYLKNLENELAYYRKRADDERERADRLQDQLLALHGHEPVTETVLRDDRALRERAKLARDERERELTEMFADSISDAEADGLELPAELQEAAKAMLSGASE